MPNVSEPLFCTHIGSPEMRGVVVPRFAVRVRTSELEAAAHPLLDIQLKRIIRGAGSPTEPPDSPEVRVDPHIFAGGIVRPQPSRGGVRGDNLIEIIASYELVEAMGAHITHRRRQVGRDLALHVDIPLLDVISLGISFGKRGGERAI